MAINSNIYMGTGISPKTSLIFRYLEFGCMMLDTLYRKKTLKNILKFDIPNLIADHDFIMWRNRNISRYLTISDKIIWDISNLSEPSYEKHISKYLKTYRIVKIFRIWTMFYYAIKRYLYNGYLELGRSSANETQMFLNIWRYLRII